MMEKGFGQHIKKTSERVKLLKRNITNIRNPEDIMMEIIRLFPDTELIPQVGKYYTFIYNAKTPKLRYDQHPLIATVAVERWGFKGINYHWGTIRSYTWNEVVGKLHIVEPEEVKDLRKIRYAKFLTK
jgi:hypothetical protein